MSSFILMIVVELLVLLQLPGMAPVLADFRNVVETYEAIKKAGLEGIADTNAASRFTKRQLAIIIMNNYICDYCANGTNLKGELRTCFSFLDIPSMVCENEEQYYKYDPEKRPIETMLPCLKDRASRDEIRCLMRYNRPDTRGWGNKDEPKDRPRTREHDSPDEDRPRTRTRRPPETSTESEASTIYPPVEDPVRDVEILWFDALIIKSQGQAGKKRIKREAWEDPTRMLQENRIRNYDYAMSFLNYVPRDEPEDDEGVEDRYDRPRPSRRQRRPRHKRHVHTDEDDDWERKLPKDVLYDDDDDNDMVELNFKERDRGSHPSRRRRRRRQRRPN